MAAHVSLSVQYQTAFNRDQTGNMKALVKLNAYLRSWTFFALFLGAIFSTACLVSAQDQENQPNNLANLPQEKVTLGPKVFLLWVASTPDQQQQGLMFVKNMAPDRGMIFVFSQVAAQTFWMKDTLISLDLIYLSQDGTIVRHYTMVPDGGQRLYFSDAPVRYAIEINAGSFTALHLHDGQQIQLPAPASAPSE